MAAPWRRSCQVPPPRRVRTGRTRGRTGSLLGEPPPGGQRPDQPDSASGRREVAVGVRGHARHGLRALVGDIDSHVVALLDHHRDADHRGIGVHEGVGGRLRQQQRRVVTAGIAVEDLAQPAPGLANRCLGGGEGSGLRPPGTGAHRVGRPSYGGSRGHGVRPNGTAGQGVTRYRHPVRAMPGGATAGGWVTWPARLRCAASGRSGCPARLGASAL